MNVLVKLRSRSVPAAVDERTGVPGVATHHQGPGRIAALDGLRALAVLLVMVGHGNLPYLERAGGPVGVTVFFVLSGFLITTMLVSEATRSGRIDLKTFYWKRFVRLAPALAVMVLVTTAVGLLLGQGWATVRDAAASLLYVSNWTQAFLRETVPQLSITWSLSVEEQYYLVWPLVLLALIRRRRWVTGLLAVAVVALVVRVVLTVALPLDVAYRLTTVNAFPLAVGGLLAALARRLPPSSVASARSRWASWRGEVAVVTLCALLGLLAAAPRVPEPIQLWIGLPVTALAAAAIWLGVRGYGVVLRLSPIVWLGRISYSLYLWHFTFLRVLHLPMVVGWVLSVVVAALSWRFVEESGRRMLLARGVWFQSPRPLVAGRS